MTQTAQQFLDEIKPLTNTNASGAFDLTDVINSLNRGIRELKKAKIYPSRNRTTLKVYPSVRRYALPEDFQFLSNIFSETGTRNVREYDADEFWVRENDQTQIMAIETELGEKNLLLKLPDVGIYTTIDNANALDLDGTWEAVASTDSVGLTTDDINYKTGGASLSFAVDVDKTANNFAAIQNTTKAAQDISAYVNKGAFLFHSYLPENTNIQGFTVRFGSDTSNYYEGTATQQFSGNTWREGWNRVGVEWANLTETGTVDNENITFVYIQLNYTVDQADQSGFLINGITLETPYVYELKYFSTRFVKAQDGTLKDNFTASGDRALLDEEDQDFLTYFCATDANLIKEQGAKFQIHAQYRDKKKREIKTKYGIPAKLPTRSYYPM